MNDLDASQTDPGNSACSPKGDILVVDDTLPNLRALSAMLTEQGYKVRGARDGPTALMIARGKPPDLILLDIRMPGMDGYQACQRLKGEAETRDIPVIFISALDEVMDKVKGFGVGGVDYITKPFQMEEVLARVQTHLALRSLREQLKVRNAQLQRANDELTREIAERQRAEAALQRMNDELEQRVEERTAELARANASLKAEIAERQRAEEERERLLVQIQEQARRVQQIMDTVPEGVLLLDPGERVALANPLGEKELAALADAQVGEPLTHLGGRPLAELLTSPPKGLWHELTVDGRSLQIIARPLETGPESGGACPEFIEGWVLVIHDVTQQREIARRIQLQERLAAVGQLAAGIAHDFNNLIATIILYAQMSARTEGLPERVRERMEVINQQAQYATSLIRQILDFSRRGALERRPMDMLVFLKEQVKLLEHTLPESVKIELMYDKGDYTVDADPTRMQQAILNLVVNARDAMPEGGRLQIGLERIQLEDRKQVPLPKMEAGEWVLLRVSDSGTGIPPGVLPHIFDPFFTTKPDGEGAGLGLAQVWGIVNQHGGHVDVATKVGEGTTFILYLPALTVHQSEMSIGEVEHLAKGQGQTVLVVEDNAAAREALVESLELLNYQVLEAANGREALEVFQQYAGEIALVLSDTVMPEMGGQALFQALRQQDPTAKVMLLTGHPMEKELENLQTQGLSGWLLKPLDLEQLAEVIARVLSS